jgi:hypothetical protein
MNTTLKCVLVRWCMNEERMNEENASTGMTSAIKRFATGSEFDARNLVVPTEIDLD